jgi:glycosyltransferase involved in cell wall biosynthesis
MRILLVHNFYREPGGEDVVFAHERKLLERNGHEVITYTRSNDEANNSSLLDRLHLLKTVVSAHDSKKEITQVIHDKRPDLAHIHNTFMMVSPSIYKACSDAQIPTVHTVHNYRMLCPATYLFRDGKVCEECITDGLLSGVRHGCYRESRVNTAAVAVMLKVHRVAGTWATKVNAFISLTEFAKQKLIANGLPAERIHVKSNFVDQDPGQRDGTGEYALFVGRLSPEKGVDTLLKAWALLKSPIPLKIVGDGPERAQLEAQSQQLGNTNVDFLGRLDQDQIKGVMKKSRFLVLPSLWYEGFPMVIAESFACGVPVLGSRLGAMQEVISDGHSGLHFTAGSADDLAQKAGWAWEHADEMVAMGRNARSEYEAKYRPEGNYAALMTIYQKAMNQA